MIVHVDDCYAVGHKRALLELVKEFGNSGLKIQNSNKKKAVTK